jgi:malate dehydrogenase (oxaloacetate-decarboxylating)(NADP+)
VTLRKEALDYHSKGRPGKIKVVPTKETVTAHDLSLAYSPGVAEPVRAIAKDPEEAYRYTAKGNLVAVISNGTAVLGLGNMGALAGKPVMEGKGVLFKRFADIDVFDIEVDSTDPAEMIRFCQLIAPTFGGINLEDIRAPECFEIEKTLIETLDIPVFHDDQHGTAIISGAALLNAVRIVGKKLGEVRVVFSGAGASAIACAKLYKDLGVHADNIMMCDSKGVLHAERKDGRNVYKEEFVRETKCRTLADAMKGADVFVGLSQAGVVTQDMVKSMAKSPIVFAMANPDPEISPVDVKAARPDAITATGRSDYPNQVNNVLGFPFIFRGALDVRARKINEKMKQAAVQALAELARRGEAVPAVVKRAYPNEVFDFGPEYIIPKPFDPRVLQFVCPAVAQAAMESGVARKPVDLGQYELRLQERTSEIAKL